MHVLSITSFNLDLLAVGIAVAATALLGSLIYFNNPRSITNRTFLYLSIATVCWGISNYFEYKFTTTHSTLWALRAHLFISTFHAFLFFQLCYVFPKEIVKFPRWYRFFVIPLTFITAALTLTPFVFSRIIVLAPPGLVTNPERGPGIVLFTLVAFGFLLSGLSVLIAKVWRTAREERQQAAFVLAAMLILASLILLFNVVLPVIFNVLLFIPYAAIFVFPFIALLSWAIYRHHLFNLKVFATGTTVFALAAFTFLEIIFSTSLTLILFRSAILVLVIATGILLIKSVLREVEQRELIEKQEQELERINERQENLLHFISHEVKGYFTKSAAAFAGIIEGDYGAIEPQLKDFASLALSENRKGVDTVVEILEAGDFKKGTVKFAHEPFDLKVIVEKAVADFKSAAEQKQLALTLSVEDGKSYTVVGDQVQLGKHVIGNLIDNSIKYTPKGSVAVSLSRKDNRILFSVKDTGVGITPEDKVRLFTEGGRGAESVRVNVHSTGYGLFIAKSIVNQHGGRIWAESEGKDKGSTFFVELPAKE